MTKGKPDVHTRATRYRRKIRTWFCLSTVVLVLTIYYFYTVFEHHSLSGDISSTHTVSHSEINADPKWPYTPFYTRGTEILNALDQPISLAGVNWPGHGLPMIPEGLQHQSIEAIVGKVKDLGMNVVRLTYATELVDDIYARGMADIPLQESLVNALGQKNGTRIYRQIARLNPELEGDGVTRLDVFDAVANALARNKVYVHLDNHISKAGWCCGLEDGNGWFGDTYFNTANWARGLEYMTNHAGAKWPSYISTSLRNEPRDSPSNPSIHATYNWSTWHKNMIPALQAVHAINPNPLIFVSGMGYDTTLEPVINGHDLGDGTHIDLASFDPSLRRKLVWELHNYNNSIKSCDALMAQLNDGGYHLLTDPARKVKNIAPILLTEFGFAQDPSSTGSNSVYAQCIASLLRTVRGGWMYWVLVGSYYEREGVQEFDEAWGMLKRDWSGWRNEEVVDGYFRGLVRDVLDDSAKDADFGNYSV